MNKDLINFSIIIPHKNLPDLLERCLQSIPQRNDLEIIVVDDNSDKNKVDFNNFPGLNRKNIKLVFEKKGRGGGAARNIGIAKARGKWLLFADCDDTYTEYLNSFLDSFVDSEVDVVYFKSNIINKINKKRIVLNMNIFIDSYLKTKRNIDDIKFGAWEPWNKMIRRSIVVENNIRFDEISSSNDLMFSLRLGKYVREIEVTSDIIYNYILREGSVIHSKKEIKFLNGFDTGLRQNALYHEIGYKRKVFMPLFFITYRKFLSIDIIKKYWKYLVVYKANPFEGFFSYLLFHAVNRFKIKNQLSWLSNR